MNHLLEIFCGTGGVGKTTLSYTRANFHASKEKKTLILTIDPSKRLKDFIKDDNDKDLQVFLFNPEETFKKISTGDKNYNNRILNLLMSKLGGMNEILSLVELSLIIKDDSYDKIILDTPPGKHFLDFLESSKKIEKFFSKTFIDVFNFFFSEKKNKSFIQKALDTGFEKLISYLEKVTGENFVKEFLEALGIIYDLKTEFLEALKVHDLLKDTSKTKWFLVTSVEQSKYEEAMKISELNFLKDHNIVALVNRTLQFSDLELEGYEKEVIQSQKDSQNRLLKLLALDFKKIQTFNQIMDNNISIQVDLITKRWEQLENDSI